LNWKDNENPYGGNGKDLYLGKWHVASVGWDGVNKTDTKWIVYLHLPGLKPRLTIQYKNIADAMIRTEQAVQSWLTGAGVTL
jgi:hypothetical protein